MLSERSVDTYQTAHMRRVICSKANHIFIMTRLEQDVSAVDIKGTGDFTAKCQAFLPIKSILKRFLL